MLLLVELILSALIFPLAYLAPRFGKTLFVYVENRAAQFAARKTFAVLAIFLLALCVRFALLHIEPIPAPGIHDEFGYLLAADTFAHGRVTNPTHPMWMHFESITIIQRPTYCSAFYPAQGLFLAFGQAIFGHPFWGVWLSTALMCAGICWALQAWMPPCWALLGGILAVIRLGTFSYWADSYWGGSVAALGGALVLGALPRIRRYHRTRDALVMALGFSILANSRPYEGIFYSVPILISLGTFIFGVKAPPWKTGLRKIVVPLAVAMAMTFAFMSYYFWRTTGNALRPPYLVDIATYFQEPQFLWGTVRSQPIQYHHPELERFYTAYHLGMFLSARSSLLAATLGKLIRFWLFFVGPAFTVPFLVLAAILPYNMAIRDIPRKDRFLLLLVCVSFVAFLLPPYFNPHYAAPMTAAGYAILLQALRRVKVWDRRSGHKGTFICRGVVGVCAVVWLIASVALTYGVPRPQVFPFDPLRTNPSRANLIQSLKQQGGRYLIIVRYSRDHDLQNEWVYNDADIDASRVVWAREMLPTEDKALVHYFHDREILLLEPDDNPPRLSPYPLERLSTSASEVAKEGAIDHSH